MVNSVNTKKRVIIHVGLPKAGSTYLQNEVFPNIPGVHYIGTMPGNPIWDYCDELIRGNPVRIDLAARKLVIENALNEVQEDVVLISREGFSGIFYNSMYGNRMIADMLKSAFPNAKIFMVLRRQDTFLESAYKQALQQGHSISINRFLGISHGKFIKPSGNQDPSPVVNPVDFDWLSMVRHYQGLFGKDNVIALPFEMLIENREMFIDRFLELSDLCNYRPSSHAPKKVNRGYSYTSCVIARCLNRFLIRPWNSCGIIPEKPFYQYLYVRKDKHKIYELMWRITRLLQLRAFLQQGLDRVLYINRNLLSSDKREMIMALHYDSNTELSRLIEIDLGAWGYC